VVDDPDGIAGILRRQLADVEPDGGASLVDPIDHGRTLAGIRGLVLAVTEVRAKFKYGGNVDAAHRARVAEELARRDGPGDRAALAQLER
jgi:transcriptional regulator